jgi:hypothetical protein
MRKWISGILASIIATIIGGVVLWYLTKEPPPPPPTPELTFVEKVQGQYTLRKWSRANKKINVGVSIDRGQLTIDQSGNADWDLTIWSSARYPKGPPANNRSRLKCGGTVFGPQQELQWEYGGKRNVAIDWDENIESVHKMVSLAFCGGESTGSSAPFSLQYEQPSAGRATLQMKNKDGIFVWEKVSG